MSLHSGLDTVAIATGGCWTKTYNSSGPGNIANLYATRGYLEDAPNVAIKLVCIVMNYFRRRGQ